MALLQTELETGKHLNDSLEKENSKKSKKVKKLTGQLDKANVKIESLETSLKALQEKNAGIEESLKVKIELNTLTRPIRFAVWMMMMMMYIVCINCVLFLPSLLLG